MNAVNLIGRFGHDPELKYAPTGKTICKFAIAISEKYGETEKTHWIDIIAWGKPGEIISQYLTKGDQIGISGRLNQETWEKDGKKRSKLVVVLEKFTFVGGKRNQAGTDQVPTEGAPTEDDIPF
jgi:single-strand DNA-binding protein